MKKKTSSTARLLAQWAKTKQTSEIDVAARSLAKQYLRRGALGELSRVVAALKVNDRASRGVQSVKIQHTGRWNEAEMRTMIGQVLYARAKAEQEIEATRDDSLLGGVVVTVGGKRITATLANRLNRLRAMISSDL